MRFRIVDLGWANFVFAFLPCAVVTASPQMASAEPSGIGSTAAPAARPTVPAPSAAAGQPAAPPVWNQGSQVAEPATGQAPGTAGAPPAPSYPPAPAGYPPPPPGYPPPPAAAGYPPQYPLYPPEVSAEQEAPSGPAPFRPLRFRFDFGMGGFSPSDVNNYLKAKYSGATTVSGFSEMVLLLSLDFSVAYYFTPWLGLRPNLLYLFSPKIMQYSGGGPSESYLLHSLAPGLSVDFAFDQGGLARFFASPGLAYQYGWFEGYSAQGVGLELALGADLSFGVARSKGISVALVLRYANLGVSSGPAVPVPSYLPTIEHLNFTSLIVRVGFQLGI